MAETPKRDKTETATAKHKARGSGSGARGSVGMSGIAKMLAKAPEAGQRQKKLKPAEIKVPAVPSSPKPAAAKPAKTVGSMEERSIRAIMEEIRGKPMGEPLGTMEANIHEPDYELMAMYVIEYAKHGNPAKARQQIGLSSSTPKRWAEKNPRFRRLVDEAKEEAADNLEYEAWRRAVEGIDKPVYRQGIEVGATKEYSDQLLMFLLKGNRPDKFRERVEHTHKGEVKFQTKTDLLAGITATINRFRARVQSGDLAEHELEAIHAAVGGNGANGSNGHGNGAMNRLTGAGNGNGSNGDDGHDDG